METNFKAGTVVKLNSCPGETFTLTGEVHPTTFWGEPQLMLTNGGLTRVGNIAEVVSVPQKLEVGTKVRFERTGNEYTIESLRGERFYVKGGGWVYEDEVEVVEPGNPALDAALRAFNEAAIQLTLLEGDNIDFAYKGENDSVASSRWIKPTELVGSERDRRVVGYDKVDSNTVKSFRLDRIQGRVDY